MIIFQFANVFFRIKGKEVVKFVQDDVEQNMAFALIKCKDTTLVIEG